MELTGLGEFLKTYGVLGIVALTSLGLVGVLREVLKLKRGSNGVQELSRNGERRCGRRWDDGDIVTPRELRDSIVELKEEVAGLKSTIHSEIAAIHRRIDDLPHFARK